MPVSVVRGHRDRILDEIIRSLEAFAEDHPTAKVDVYRWNSVSVRVRIVDPAFSEFSKAERSRLIWRKYLIGLSDEAQSDISSMTLLTPEEAPRSIANLEFDDPSVSEIAPLQRESQVATEG